MSNSGQRSIFDVIYETVTGNRSTYQWEIFVDGASRGNPGVAGAGVYICYAGKDHTKKGFLLGQKTNNEAEYLALLIAVLLIKKEVKEGEAIKVVSDSQLLIRQLQGKYKVKKDSLKTIYQAIKTEIGDTPCKFEHVMREHNVVADELANKGIDKKNALPIKFLDILRTYEIFL